MREKYVAGESLEDVDNLISIYQQRIEALENGIEGERRLRKMYSDQLHFPEPMNDSDTSMHAEERFIEWRDRLGNPLYTMRDNLNDQLKSVDIERKNLTKRKAYILKRIKEWDKYLK